MTSSELSGINVLLTGASGGIGRAIAIRLSSMGATLLLHYNNSRDKLEKTHSELPGEGHFPVAADLADPGAIEKMVKESLHKFDRIHVLINNAGVYLKHPILDTSLDDWKKAWEKTIAVNLSGPACLTYFLGRHMAESGGGKIINVTSRGAFRGEPDAPAYGASKAALNSMSQSLAKALAPHGVFLYAVAPGWVNTAMAAPGLTGPEGDSIRNQSPLGRVAEPEDIAEVVGFLATGNTEYMTGCIIDINGASYLRS